MKNKMNKMNENEMTMSVIIMSVITGLILSFWIICVSAIMIPVLIDEAKISSESMKNESVSVNEAESMSVENISADDIESITADNDSITADNDGPRVFRYVGDWNSSGNGNVNENVNKINYNNVIKPTTTQWLNTTAGDMIAELRENALRAESKYQDANIIVTGRICNIDSDGKYIGIGDTFGHYMFDSIMCYITNEQQRNIVENLNVGDSVTVCGQITDIGEILGYVIDMSVIRVN